MFVNGQSLGKQKSAEHFFYFRVPNVGESALVAVAGGCRDESHIRKVGTFNDAYRMQEKGAVLNWFDITAPEGYFSLNDKVSAIMASEEGKTFFMSIMEKNMPAGAVGQENGGAMMQMMGSFSVIRLLGLLGATGVKMTKEEMLALNAQLNQIKKPE